MAVILVIIRVVMFLGLLLPVVLLDIVAMRVAVLAWVVEAFVGEILVV